MSVSVASLDARDRPSATGQSVVVTGGGSGIGAAVAELFGTRGSKVALVGRTTAKVQAVASEICSRGGEAHAFGAALQESRMADIALSSAASFLGGIDVLVNCAGIYREGPFAELTDEVVDALVDINLKSVVFTTRSALRWLQEGSCIVNIASMSAIRPLDDQVLYAAVKAAVVHLGTGLARELAPRHIRVNTVSPGPTRTPILSTIVSEDRIPEIQRGLATRIPLGRLAEPEEVARAVGFLVDSPFATGTHVVLDGGITL